MARHSTPVALLLLAGALLYVVSLRAQPQRAPEELGISGYVLDPDGTPVSSGRVVIQPTTTSIERTGRFRVVPNAAGVFQLIVGAPGLAVYRVNVSVPPSRTLRLPVIRLSPATYFRVRFVSIDGEPITSGLARYSFDTMGRLISGTVGDRTADQIDGDGTITIGPLPKGITTLALDQPPFARTRLPDLMVTGAETLLDGGVVTVPPGAVLHVDLVDAGGAPVSGQEVFVEEARALSPLGVRAVRTNPQGRATFDRLGEGQYRVRTSTLGRCGSRSLPIARVVAIGGNGALRTRLVVSGTANFRFISPFGPLRGAAISAIPDGGVSAPPSWLRSQSDGAPTPMRPGMSVLESPCRGATDADGRVTLSNFPPGAARIEVGLLNSRFLTRANIPEDGREIPIAIPDGFLPLRVTNALKNQAVAGAAITWASGGTRVEATTSAIGEALLEGVGRAAGTLSINANGFLRGEAKLSEPPATLFEIALTPAPSTMLEARVLTSAGEPVPNAVVHLTPASVLDIDEIAATDVRGVVRFSGVLPGTVRLVAHADRFVSAGMQVSDNSRNAIVLTLSRGYRVIASVDLPAEAGPQLVRVSNASGESMDRFLDTIADRALEPPRRISLGPLPPGTYIVELHGVRKLQERIRIVDGDVHVTIR